MAAITLPREFYLGNSTPVAFTIQSGENLLAATVHMRARREYDGTEFEAVCYNLTATGEGVFNMTVFCSTQVDPTGTDIWLDAHIHVVNGANTNDFRLWAPDGRFHVIDLP